jgi:hypothetical protein
LLENQLKWDFAADVEMISAPVVAVRGLNYLALFHVEIRIRVLCEAFIPNACEFQLEVDEPGHRYLPEIPVYVPFVSSATWLPRCFVPSNKCCKAVDPVAAQSKVTVSDRSLAVIAGSNPARGIDVCLF